MDETHLTSRLNPFALPSETGARFNLLVAAAAIVVFNLGAVAVAKLLLGPFSVLSISGFGVLSGQQVEAAQELRALFSLSICSASLVLLLFGLAYLRFVRHPQAIHRKQGLHPADSQKDARLLQAVADLARQAGISPPPRIALGPVGAVDGQAFGLKGRRELRLGSHINRLRIKQPARFQALILHELAHLVNRDVDRSYFAEAVWRVLLVLVLPLMILILAGYGIAYVQFEPPTGPLDWLITLVGAIIVMAFNGLIQAVELGCILLIVALIRRGALRTREKSADWRAVQWGAQRGLEEILSEAADRPQAGWWKRLLRFHPAPAERLEALRKPEILFRLTADLPVSIGFLMGYLIAGGTTLLGAALALWKIGFSSSGFGGLVLTVLALFVLIDFLLISLAAAGLVTGTLGLQLQRNAAADLASGQHGWRKYFELGKPALLIPITFELGVLTMPYDTITIVPFLTGNSLTFLLLPLWMIFLAVSLWVWMFYVRFFTLKIAGAATGGNNPQSWLNGLAVTATLLLPVLCLPAAAARLALLGYSLEGWILLVTPVLALVILLGVWGLSWAAVAWLDQQKRCPSCAKKTGRRNVLVERCEYCHSELASWIYKD